MTEEKAWYKSKTVWSGLLTSVVGLVGLLGFTGYVIEPEDIDQLAGLIVSGITVFAGMVSIIGRITAKKSLK